MLNQFEIYKQKQHDATLFDFSFMFSLIPVIWIYLVQVLKMKQHNEINANRAKIRI